MRAPPLRKSRNEPRGPCCERADQDQVVTRVVIGEAGVQRQHDKGRRGVKQQ
jgi:hypothetical protein